MIGVVTGLEYLHMIHMPPLVHRDLKPANVLLDHDIEAQTANFRIAKSTPGANTRITSSNVAGTLGCITPDQSIKREELAFLDDDDDDAVAGLTLMKNGSLQDILQQVQVEERQLVWLARHKIVIGVVSGLEYFHTSDTPPLVHRDLKPANVLLDDDMEAWIDDFGIAKLTSDANIHHKFKFCGNIRMYCAPVSSNN
ncbi:leucine-rich repeat receptor-like serine/threonine/tyrosine-protein kinase SOBIR1 [Tanacetum coccineum]